MGFFLEIADNDRVYEKLQGDPASFFHEPFAGYLFFLFESVDAPWLEWIKRHATALDRITGKHVAFAMFAAKSTICVRPGSPGFAGPSRPWHSRARAPEPVTLNSHELVATLTEDFSITRLVRSGLLGRITTETNLELINAAVTRIAEEFQVADQIPCLIAIDPVPTSADDFTVIPLDTFQEDPDALYKLIRRAVPQFRKHPTYKSFAKSVETIRDLQGKLTEADNRVVPDPIDMEGKRKHFVAAMSAGDVAVIAEQLEPLELDDAFKSQILEVESPQLSRLGRTLRTLVEWREASWPLNVTDLSSLDDFVASEWEQICSFAPAAAALYPAARESKTAFNQWMGALGKAKTSHAHAVYKQLTERVSEEDLGAVWEKHHWAMVQRHRLAQIGELQAQLASALHSLATDPKRPSWAGTFSECHEQRKAAGAAPRRVTNQYFWMPLLRGPSAAALCEGDFRKILFQTENEFGLDAGARDPRVVVSYSSKDKDIVSEHVRSLRALTPYVFRDQDSLRVGEPWEQRIGKEIDNCDVLILYWSQNSANSPEVEKEWKRALEKQKQIKPIKIPVNADPPKELKDIHFG